MGATRIIRTIIRKLPDRYRLDIDEMTAIRFGTLARGETAYITQAAKDFAWILARRNDEVSHLAPRALDARIGRLHAAADAFLAPQAEQEG